VLDIEHESDIERLRQLALLQKSQLERLVAMLARKCAELQKLKGGEDELQLTLKLLEDAQKQVAQAEKLARPRGGRGERDTLSEPQRGHGPTEQLALERVQLRCELDDADRACPQCGDRLEPLAGQFETSEMIDVVEVKYQVVQVERQKYVCKCGSAVETAPGPERAIAGGRYSLRFALKVGYDKYVAHLPLERQARLMAHAGLEVTSQTLWDQCWAATRLLEPTYDAIFRLLRAGPVVGVDQTGWPDLEDKSLPPWQMWCVTAPGLVYHRICDDKSAATFTSLLGDYHGWVVADALGTHDAGAKHCRGVKLAACWAHVLRRFRDAVADHPEAQIMLAWIQDLYRIDQKATDLDERGRLRSTESEAVLDKMRAWLLEQQHPKSTTIGGAVRYTLRQWGRLTAFVQDPVVWLDNNPTERALRGPVLGRRNHFGSKSVRGTEMAAILYSLVETAKVCGLDPIAYLLEVATRARRSPGAVLLPGDFKAVAAAA
jgi:transposase